MSNGILDQLAKHQTVANLARHLGRPDSTVRDMVRRARLAGQSPVRTAMPAAGKVQPRTLADFRNAYDKSTIVPTKIRAALQELGSGWLTEREFCSLAQINAVDMSLFRDEFAEHVVTLRDRTRAWAGTTRLAEQMRAVL